MFTSRRTQWPPSQRAHPSQGEASHRHAPAASPHHLNANGAQEDVSALQVELRQLWEDICVLQHSVSLLGQGRAVLEELEELRAIVVNNNEFVTDMFGQVQRDLHDLHLVHLRCQGVRREEQRDGSGDEHEGEVAPAPVGPSATQWETPSRGYSSMYKSSTRPSSPLTPSHRGSIAEQPSAFRYTPQRAPPLAQPLAPVHTPSQRAAHVAQPSASIRVPAAQRGVVQPPPLDPEAKTFYVVVKGQAPGIYSHFAWTEKLVEKLPKEKRSYVSKPTLQEALHYYRLSYQLNCVELTGRKPGDEAEYGPAVIQPVNVE